MQFVIIQNVVINNDAMFSWGHARLGMWIIFYDIMIITNAC